MRRPARIPARRIFAPSVERMNRRRCVSLPHPVGGSLNFEPTYVRRTIDHLPIEVAGLHYVTVDQRIPTDAGGDQCVNVTDRSHRPPRIAMLALPSATEPGRELPPARRNNRPGVRRWCQSTASRPWAPDSFASRSASRMTVTRELRPPRPRQFRSIAPTFQHSQQKHPLRMGKRATAEPGSRRGRRCRCRGDSSSSQATAAS